MDNLKLSQREQSGRIQHTHSVECKHCGGEKRETAINRRRGDDVMPQVPCQGSDGCTKMLCESCRGECLACGLDTCREHLAPVEIGDNELWCEVCRKAPRPERIESAEFDRAIRAAYEHYVEMDQATAMLAQMMAKDAMALHEAGVTVAEATWIAKYGKAVN